jgi:hypothetical protein
MATLISGMSLLNSSLGVIQRMSFGKRIAETELIDEPIFVVGHWRSGTTLLHELLVQDAQFTYPSTYACFCPNHFLVSEWWLKRMIGLFLPRKRPMDNMAIGWDLPQEDEWALCNMGLPSPYRKIMFPNLPMHDREYQSLRELSPNAREHWLARFKWLLQALTVRESKRIVLKTPVHTFRVAALREIFPDARFIHIARNPFDVFPSTIHTWQRLYRYQGLQVPKFEHLEEEVLQTFADMYAVFEQDKQNIAPENIQQVRYEELAADPVRVLRDIYERFELPVSQQVQSGWDAYAARSADYQTNRYHLTAAQQSQIAERWSSYFSNYGYSTEVSV